MRVHEGDYLTARRDFIDYDDNYILEKGKKYRVDIEWRSGVFGYGYGYCINSQTFYTSGIIKYFYTKQEERELKLNKINIINESISW